MNTNCWKKYFMKNSYWWKYLVNTNSYKYKEAERVSAVFNAVTKQMAAVLIEIYFMTIITLTIL